MDGMMTDGINTLVEVLVWPDYSWIWVEDYEDVTDAWRGDDFIRITVQAGIDEELIEGLLRHKKVQG